MIVLLLAQAISGPVLPVVRRPVPQACPPAGGADDVVVCARPQDEYRLQPLPPRPDEPLLPAAEIGLGGTRLAAEAEQATLAGGQQTKRLMVRWKIPLGGKQ